MGISSSFDVLADLPAEQRLAFVELALREPYPPLQSAAFDLLADAEGLNRLDLLLGRYAALPPELRLRMVQQKDRFLAAAHAMAASDREIERRDGLVALAALDPFATATAVARALDDPAPAIRETAAGLLDDLGMRYYYHLVAARLHNDLESRAYIERQRAGMLDLLAPMLRLFPRHEKRVFFDIAIESEPESYALIVDHVLLRGEPGARHAFLQALGSSSTEQAVRLLFRLAAERSHKLRDAAVEVLRRRSDPGFPSLVASMLSRLPKEDFEGLAAKSLDLPWWPSVEALPAVDAASAARLLDFAAKSGVAPRRRDELILQFMGSPYPETRVRVLSLLQVLEHPGFGAVAESALEDPSDDVKIAAARAVIGLDPPHKARLLLPLLNAPNDELRRLATREVASASLDRFLNAFGKLDAPTRETAARALAKIDARIVERLADEIGSLDADRRLAALRVIDVLGAEEGLRESLMQLLQDPDRRVRATAVKVVQVAGNGDGLRLLVNALDDTDRRVRANAVEAFEDAGDVRCVDILLPLLHDPDNRVRANAAKALCGYGRPEGRATIEAMLVHPEELMRLSAAWAVGQVRFEGAELLLRERGAVEKSALVREKIMDSLARLQTVAP